MLVVTISRSIVMVVRKEERRWRGVWWERSGGRTERVGGRMISGKFVVRKSSYM